MANSRFHGAAGRWFAKTLEEYAKMIENGASYAELLAWSEGKWPEFGLKYGAWMNARSQRDLTIHEWQEVSSAFITFLICTSV